MRVVALATLRVSRAIRKERLFRVNYLSDAHEDVARAFSGKIPAHARFEIGDWDMDARGAPLLGDAEHYERWADVMTAEFARLREAAARGEPTMLDPYGGENEGEFFAVATEVFFERAADLKREHPALYAELSAYYRLDPAAWG